MSDEYALPRYGVAGWPEHSGPTGMILSGVMREGSNRAESAMSVGVNYHRGDGTLQVTSHRPAHASLAAVRRHAIEQAHAMAIGPVRGGPAPGRERDEWSPDESLWVDFDIAVDDEVTPFSLAVIGDGWAAVGEGPRSLISIVSHRIPTAGVALVSLADVPIRLPGPSVPPRPRARRFPDDQLAEPARPANVVLSYFNNRLTGNVNGIPVDVEMELPRSQSTAVGTFAGSRMSAAWQLGNNYTDFPDISGSLLGRFADRAVTLTGIFHLDGNWVIESAEISGDIGGDAIHAVLEPLDGGLSDSRTVGIAGEFAGTPFDLAATISGDLTGGMIRGTAGADAVRLDSRVEPGSRAMRLSGSYQGPLALLAVIVATFLFFN